MVSGEVWIADKPKLYVGCALTEAPEAFTEAVEELKGNLIADWHVLQFLGLVDGTSGDVYSHDIAKVDECDAFLAITSYPSIGLGLELGRAREVSKPTLMTQEVNTRVTRMILGAAELLPTFSFAAYDDFQEDVPEMLRLEFAHILNPASHTE